MWPDRVSKRGPLALESDALPTAPRGLAVRSQIFFDINLNFSASERSAPQHFTALIMELDSSNFRCTNKLDIYAQYHLISP